MITEDGCISRVGTKKEKGDKPDSVFYRHSSRDAVTGILVRPTRRFGLVILKHRPIWTCTTQSLPDFTTAEPYILSVALVLASRRTGVTRCVTMWCPDFPPGQKPQRRYPLLVLPPYMHKSPPIVKSSFFVLKSSIEEENWANEAVFNRRLFSGYPFRCL